MAATKLTKRGQRKAPSPKEAGKTTALKDIEKTINELCELLDTLTPAN